MKILNIRKLSILEKNEVIRENVQTFLKDIEVPHLNKLLKNHQICTERMLFSK